MTIPSFLASSRRAYPILGRLTFWLDIINKRARMCLLWTIEYLRSGYGVLGGYLGTGLGMVLGGRFWGHSEVNSGPILDPSQETSSFYSYLPSFGRG